MPLSPFQGYSHIGYDSICFHSAGRPTIRLGLTPERGPFQLLSRSPARYLLLPRHF